MVHIQDYTINVLFPQGVLKDSLWEKAEGYLALKL